MKRTTGRITMGLVLGVSGLIFSARTDATIIAGNGPTSNWMATDQSNAGIAGGSIGENVTISNSGGSLNNNWYLHTVTLSLFKRSVGTAADVQVYLIPGTQVAGTYVDQSASAVASLTIPFASVPWVPVDSGYGTPTTYSFTTFSDPQGIITPGNYYLEFQTPGETDWYLYAHRDGGNNTYAGGAEWYQATSNTLGVNADFDTYFILEGDPVNVPEPSLVALFGLGGLLCWRTWRKRD